MIVLDTNVISGLWAPEPAERVVQWVDAQPVDDLFLTAVTTAELRYGVSRLPDGWRKERLSDRMHQVLHEDFAGRVLPFDDEASGHYAQIVADRERRGEPFSMADALIAATCRSYGARLATRNGKDFRSTGVDLVNPWT